jgi:hypothetical protein
MFDSTKEDLVDILRNIDAGKLQLPEFQRSYVWNDSDVRSLIASVAKGYPVGALLTLQSGGDVKFKPRLIEGVAPKAIEPSELLLDGQQRMTSLYQVAFSKAPVRTRTDKKVEVERYYYLDMKKAVSANADIGEAIVAVPADRIVRGIFGKEELDLSTQEKEFENDLFPLNQIFDPKDWSFGWRDHCKTSNRDVYELERAFDKKIVDPFQRYKMPIIRLDKNNSREAICLVFEKVNVGGKKLDAFELVTAIYAAFNFDLRQDWDGGEKLKQRGRRQRIIGFPNRRDVVSELANTDFLQGCTLLHTRGIRLERIADKTEHDPKDLPAISCSRDALLALPLSFYRKYADRLETGFVAAADFLNEQKIIWHKDVPYPPQIVALASTIAIVGDAALTAAAKEKLATWFWSGVLAEQYGSATESRLARDVPDLVEWISGNRNFPRSMGEALFQADRLRTLRSRLSAAYKGIHALLMRQGCRDFISGKPTDIMTFFNEKIDIHHVFPQSWCLKNGKTPGVFNSIVNKTPLSKKSNIAIGGDAPSIYLRRIQEKQGLNEAKLDEILRTHLIEPKLLRADDFEGFFSARMKVLANMVGGAMGKPVVEGESADEIGRNEIDAEEIEENEALEGEAA